jgi:hypothetical protein
MKKMSWTLGFALFAALIIPVVASEPTAFHPDRLSSEIQVAPVPQTRHFMITTVVKRLETGEILWAPKVNALAGVQAAVSSGGDAIKFKATYLVDGTSAKYTVEAEKDGEPLFHYSGTLQLAEPQAARTCIRGSTAPRS